MSNIPPILKAMLRVAEDRVRCAQRNLEDTHPDDMSDREHYTKLLAEAQASLADKLEQAKQYNQ